MLSSPIKVQISRGKMKHKSTYIAKYPKTWAEKIKFNKLMRKMDKWLLKAENCRYFEQPSYCCNGYVCLMCEFGKCKEFKSREEK